MMGRLLGPALAILIGSTFAGAQMRGGGARPSAGGFGASTSGARPSTGGFRGGANFVRPQTTMPQTYRPIQPARNFSSGNRNYGAFQNGGRSRSNGASGLSQFFSRTYNPTVLLPQFYNVGWGFPFYPNSYYSPFYSPYGPSLMGGYPYAGGYGYPGFYGDPAGQMPVQPESNDSANETPWVQGNPPRADALDENSAFHRPDPRSVAITLDGASVPVPTDGGPIVIGSGNHTLRLTTQSDDPAKNSKTGREATPEKPSQ